ncbi:uncharacterized protein CTRU02_206691 [Colletotrichum truncatum]|uniref:Uncharacterized protein n=1 Tax=Colletotrichum truncatum TaxID=5467 RepID=A0ACC3Z7L1_COLTU|nr:uncharacterized protein CTRU02_13813 [Colletotrichum truncatum]KAF6782987.1 hypothetical protein CTRU02_13813 [Colletotrichum truncatum]
MTPLPEAALQGYQSKTFVYKSTSEGDILLDVLYPKECDGTPQTVVLHYHGGYLVVGDRYAFFPYWLFRACVSRKWIFVTPDYRLMPESTAHSAVEDAADAYEWVLSTLPSQLGNKLGSVLMAGSSAGGYLALTTATLAQTQPSALLLIYGMLDATNSRYTTRGTNIFGRPTIETGDILAKFPPHKDGDSRKKISAYPAPANPETDLRFGLMSALHIDALFLDYMSGIDGLGQAVASGGVEAIPKSERILFPLTFGDLSKVPRTMLLHGRNDSAVPVELSLTAWEKLKAAGVEVLAELPEDAEHGFDARAGDVDVESAEGEKTTAYESLRKAITFFDTVVSV